MKDSAVLDFRRTSNSSEPMQTEDHGAGPARCVYVIDDEIQVLEVIEMQLVAAGYAVKTFSRASDFLGAVEHLLPGIIISDQRMPEIDGLHLQRELQKWKHKFPLIILTGFPETRVAVKAMKQGAITVLDKPYNKTQLIASIEEAFETLDRTITEDDQLPPILSNGTAYKDRLSGR